MGQIDRFVERTLKPPSAVMRIWQAVLAALFVVQAVVHHRFEDVLAAVVFVGLMLPAAIAPNAFSARLGAWERDRPRLSDAIGFLFMTCAGFLALRYFLDRTPSALIAVALALILIPIGHIRRRERRQSE